MRSHSSLPRISPLGLSGHQPLRFKGYCRRSAPKHCCAGNGPAHAATLLRKYSERVLMDVVGLLANGHTVFNHNLVHAATTAVMPARGGFPFAAYDVARASVVVCFLRLLQRCLGAQPAMPATDRAATAAALALTNPLRLMSED